MKIKKHPIEKFADCTIYFVLLNIIIARTFFENIPESLHESAMLDGANDIRVLTSIILPISKPILSVLVLFYAVSHWNNYFSALVYLPNKNLQPLQVFLAKVLIDNSDQLLGDMEGSYVRNMYGIQLKYAAVIVATLPIYLHILSSKSILLKVL